MKKSDNASGLTTFRNIRVLRLLLHIIWPRRTNSTASGFKTLLDFASSYTGIVTVQLRHALASKKSSRRWGIVVVALGALIAILSRGASRHILKAHVQFFWHACFTPVRSTDSRKRLDQFYSGQAEIYDITRNRLLRGRETMLKLSASHLQQLHRAPHKHRRVWVDVGGGTGYNIEKMIEIMSLDFFDAIYIVDLCQPLLNIAEERFSKLGCSNVHILCQDAAQFVLPEEGWTAETALSGSLTFVTISYSLSMIPNYCAVIDRINGLISPEMGLISVVDFYTSGKPLPERPQEYAIGGFGKRCGWISRWFWQIWFEFDNVFLGPQRREYLEHKFGTVKILNRRNHYFLPWVMGIPYFIWLGRPANCRLLYSARSTECSDKRLMGYRGMNETPHTPYSYQLSTSSRLPFDEERAHRDFHTFMYTFTWEDPFEDMKHLHSGNDGSMLAITSAGDNALHYAIEGRPHKIHCVDMNPCQGHLLELKLAALRSLCYEEFFQMFGNGRLGDFSNLLYTKFAPHMSSSSLQFWDRNRHLFDSSSTFYMSGYSGRAITLARWLFFLTGRSGDVQRLCSAKTVKEQEQIWKGRLRPIVLNPLVVFFLRHPVFCWNALGVPMKQRKMILEEGTIYDYIKDTFDLIPAHGLFKEGAYHYLLTLLGEYIQSSCPLYLSRRGFETMQANAFERIESFNIHTDTIASVLSRLPSDDLSCAILMDHLDWFDAKDGEAYEEIDNLWRVLKPGGLVLLRSASRKPWYIDLFISTGFRATLLKARARGTSEALDGVNMYASFWKAEKP